MSNFDQTLEMINIPYMININNNNNKSARALDGKKIDVRFIGIRKFIKVNIRSKK